MTNEIDQALQHTDWVKFSDQKAALIAACDNSPQLEGLLNWIDQLQDAIVQQGLISEHAVFPHSKEEPSQDALDQLYDLASNSTFFKQDDLMLRIDYTANSGFHCHDELTGEEYWVRFDEIDFEKDTFHRLEVVKLNELVVDLKVNS
jgi:hypothetical protein